MYQWTVIGAGPAGISAIASLLDHQINPKKICWIDPEFQVGDFGTKWGAVDGNTKVKSFRQYFQNFDSFQYNDIKKNFQIFTLDEQQTCKLNLVTDVLLSLTRNFKDLVNTVQSQVQGLNCDSNNWIVTFADKTAIQSERIILATGATPKYLNYQIDKIDLQNCFDQEILNKHIKQNETVAVFGSSHSAILVLKNLVELGVSRVINFYQSPLKYALELDDCILYDNTGLKGLAAQWAKDCLSNSDFNLVERYIVNNSNIEHYLPQCNKAVYAIGFDRKNNIKIDGLEKEHSYDHHTGIIAPGLFGLGIAYPEYVTNKFGVSEYNVGLLKFARFLNKVTPIWLRY